MDSMSLLQQIIGKALRHWFPDDEILENHRPDWMRGMELDFYLPSRNVAVEVQGAQHYKFVRDFHNSESDLQAQRRRDNMKIHLCQRMGIVLLVVRTKHRLMFGGLANKLRTHCGTPMKRAPKALRDEWDRHAKKLNGWKSVLDDAINRAGKLPPNPSFDDRIARLQSVCTHLQSVAGDNPFFLSHKDAGKVLEMTDPYSVQAIMRGLEREGFLKTESKGTAIKAARYRLATKQ